MDVILGAGSGIGAAYAGVVAEHNPSGAGVVLADITVEPASRVADRLGLTEAVIAHADLGDRSSLDALAAQFDDLGVLVLTAGVSPSMASAEVVLDIDLAGVARALDAFESKVVAGSVAVVMASIMGHMAPATDIVDVELDNPLAPDLVGRLVAAGANAGDAGHAYMLAKRGVLRLARRRALEWGAKGGRVVSASQEWSTPQWSYQSSVAGAAGCCSASSTPPRSGRAWPARARSLTR